MWGPALCLCPLPVPNLNLPLNVSRLWPPPQRLSISSGLRGAGGWRHSRRGSLLFLTGAGLQDSILTLRSAVETELPPYVSACSCLSGPEWPSRGEDAMRAGAGAPVRGGVWEPPRPVSSSEVCPAPKGVLPVRAWESVPRHGGPRA